MHRRAWPFEDFPSCGWLWFAIGPGWFGTAWFQGKMSQLLEAAERIPKEQGPKHEGPAPPEAPGKKLSDNNIHMRNNNIDNITAGVAARTTSTTTNTKQQKVKKQQETTENGQEQTNNKQ